MYPGYKNILDMVFRYGYCHGQLWLKLKSIDQLYHEDLSIAYCFGSLSNNSSDI